MKAILNSDGSIKIIAPTEEPIVKHIEIHNNNQHIKSAENASKQLKDEQKTRIFLEDDKISKFNQVPRQVFMATICHVIIKFQHFKSIINRFFLF